MGLRVQSGSARGRYIKARPKGLEVRPILARIRKSLFDILRPRLPGVRFLDLFAGTGTVGIEALSNGAASATFVDMRRESCRMIEKNLADLGFTDKGFVHEMSATGNLGGVGGPFGLVFMGPPYKDGNRKPLALTIPALRAVDAANLLAAGGWVMGQHHEKEPLAGVPAGWEIFRQREYGDTTLSFFRKTSL